MAKKLSIAGCESDLGGILDLAVFLGVDLGEGAGVMLLGACEVLGGMFINGSVVEGFSMGIVDAFRGMKASSSSSASLGLSTLVLPLGVCLYPAS